MVAVSAIQLDYISHNLQILATQNYHKMLHVSGDNRKRLVSKSKDLRYAHDLLSPMA